MLSKADASSSGGKAPGPDPASGPSSGSRGSAASLVMARPRPSWAHFDEAKEELEEELEEKERAVPRPSAKGHRAQAAAGDRAGARPSTTPKPHLAAASRAARPANRTAIAIATRLNSPAQSLWPLFHLQGIEFRPRLWRSRRFHQGGEWNSRDTLFINLGGRWTKSGLSEGEARGSASRSNRRGRGGEVSPPSLLRLPLSLPHSTPFFPEPPFFVFWGSGDFKGPS